MLRLKIKAEYNDGMASQYKAAQTRLRKFEEAGPPTEQPREQQVTMRLKGGRTGKRAVVCEGLELQVSSGVEPTGFATQPPTLDDVFFKILDEDKEARHASAH